MSAADGLSRLAALVPTQAMRRRVVLGLAALVLALCALLPSKLPFWRLLSPRWYVLTASDRAGAEALRVIPSGASVTAQDAIVPHLSQRERIYALRASGIATDYVIASRDVSSWPHAGWDVIAGMLDEKRRAGYTSVFEREGWVVLARPDPRRGTSGQKTGR
jgi:hypothetical protein